ncbi:hypothetical protein E0I26_16225 [Flavobacterium rhamnosiphilum]|uniref:Uncharacterized protein n=1 Tax=Flavobacterium rhamnosiphilum TaxID=2541724 RepID=A0A4R5F347_9FLAO|nr:hypothetical protein [Flavobacterium rhamnosiphilum]TDE41577.1 hypothetical protein E0I26_16225 [Flavobacterium rhamnosiphilum]
MNMCDFRLKLLTFYKQLFIVVLFFVFVPVKANVLFAATSASPFFQGIYLKNYTATSSVSKAATVCKADWYGCAALCQNNYVPRIDAEHNDL